MTQASQSDQPLQWKLFIRRRPSATQGTPTGKDELKWVANTTTLIHGKRDALLVDTFLSEAQTAELADWIAGSGKRLSTIYITHAHPDHFFGLKLLLDRFPEARAIAPAQVVDAMQAALAPEAVENWRRRFPGLIPSELASAERLDGGTFDLEGHEIVPIDIGHTDTDHTTCLHLPSIGLVIAGDAIYNDTHPYLVESNRQGLGDWLAAIDKIEALNPRAVVVGHGPIEPDNAPRHIQETRRYIQDFIRLDDETRTAQELYDRMLALSGPDQSGVALGQRQCRKNLTPCRSVMMGCRSMSKRPEGCHAFAAYPTASQKLQLRVHNDEGGMHPGVGLVREIRCAAIFDDVTAAIAECHGVFSLRLFAKHAEQMWPGIAEIKGSRLKYQYSPRLRLREREPPPRAAHRDRCCWTAP